MDFVLVCFSSILNHIFFFPSMFFPIEVLLVEVDRSIHAICFRGILPLKSCCRTDVPSITKTSTLGPIRGIMEGVRVNLSLTFNVWDWVSEECSP